MASTGLLSSFLAAIQASLSVLLVILYGGIAAHLKLLDSSTGKTISKICVRMFLPALLLVKIGSELHAGSADRYGIILLWAFFCHLLSFIIGAVGVFVFKFPDWTIVSILFNNTTSYPLLLIQALDETGILSSLIVTNETSREAIERAKSYFLVFATVSSCLTFAIGPRLIDFEHGPEPTDDDKPEGPDDEEDSLPSPHPVPDENTSLLARADRRVSIVAVSFWPPRQDQDSSRVAFDRRPSVIGKRRWLRLGPRMKWWLLFFYDFLNAPLLGAVLGAVIGLIPVLHRAFFSDTQDGGIFTAWLTASFKTIGGLFVPLPVIIAGVSLYSSYQITRAQSAEERQAAKVPWVATTFILVVRFVLWPVISIAIIYALAKRNVLSDDPMLWFTMGIMPTGPSAMKLITMVQISDAGDEEEHKIAKLLTISYVLSPILAFTVVGSLKASQAVMGS